MKQVDIREGALRQHRALALFCVVQCWLRQLDGLVIDRPHLERILGLERFKKQRVTWLQEDFKDFFPYQETFWYQRPGKPFASLYLSKQPFGDFLPVGTMSDSERISGMSKGGPKLELFKIWSEMSSEKLKSKFGKDLPFLADASNYDERIISSYLFLLAQGLISPKSMAGLE